MDNTIHLNFINILNNNDAFIMHNKGVSFLQSSFKKLTPSINPPVNPELYIACANGNCDYIQRQMNQPEFNINKMIGCLDIDNGRGSPLEIARKYQQKTLCQYLLQHPDIDPNVGSEPSTPLYNELWNSSNQDLEIFTLLLEHPKTDFCRWRNSSLLDKAIYLGQFDKARVIAADPRIEYPLSEYHKIKDKINETIASMSLTDQQVSSCREILEEIDERIVALSTPPSSPKAKDQFWKQAEDERPNEEDEVLSIPVLGMSSSASSS